jgi:hypothetical protein
MKGIYLMILLMVLGLVTVVVRGREVFLGLKRNIDYS